MKTFIFILISCVALINAQERELPSFEVFKSEIPKGIQELNLSCENHEQVCDKLANEEIQFNEVANKHAYQAACIVLGRYVCDQDRLLAKLYEDYVSTIRSFM